MTNQSQPLTLKLSNGKEVSIADAKSVLRHTENGQQRSCAIVRGPAGTAIYNAEGDVQINGAPSSVHWLQPGDTLEFGKRRFSVGRATGRGGASHRRIPWRRPAYMAPAPESASMPVQVPEAVQVTARADRTCSY